jgi:hypothetical protein
MGDGERKSYRYGGVYGVATRLQDVHADTGGVRLNGHDHGVTRADRLAGDYEARQQQ